MFCMNCGQTLPDGAKFCLNCGTPQGAVVPTVATGSETINLNGSQTFVPAMCPNCNAHMKVDSSSKIARCDACGTECLVQDAIKTLTVRGSVQVGNATINVNGTNTESLLKRVEIMLADGDFKGAMSKCDTILDSDPTNGEVYIYMLMADLKCRSRNDFLGQMAPFDKNPYYIKAIQYGDDRQKSELTSYLNAVNVRIEEKQKAELEKRLRYLKVGDKFYFGSYYERTLSWKVLKIQDHNALVISADQIFITSPYHRLDGGTTWSDCTLRRWLNNDFTLKAFNQMERERIVPCDLNNEDNRRHKTPGGTSTNDMVFLLSIDEAKKLFAKKQKDIVQGYWWWLRSPGCNSGYAAIVYNDSIIFDSGRRVSENGGVRPAMWIKLD